MSSAIDSIDMIEVCLENLKEDPNNPNRMPDPKLKLLVQSITNIGFLQPVLVREEDAEGKHQIVDGHHRVRAATEAGLTKVPCVVVETGDDIATIMQIGMNQLRGQLDLGAVGQNISTLFEDGWALEDLQLTGFSTKELDDLMKAVTEDEPDVMAQPIDIPAEPKAEVDKTWSLELVFETKSELRKVKRRLKKAAGTGNDLSVGLLKILEGDE